MDRLLKILWLVIGFLLVLLLPVVGYFFIKDKFIDVYDDEFQDQSLIVGEEQRKAIKEGKMKQGIVYDQMEEIPGTIYHMLAVSAQKFKTPKDIENFYKEVEDTRSRAGDFSLSGIYGCVNIIFFDGDYKVINTLLDRKGFIGTYYSARLQRYDDPNKLDPTIKNILYLIAFEDTNNDGLLNDIDAHDLYISNIDGTNLKQVTRNLQILDFNFITNNTEVFITYENRDSTLDEYKRKHFSKYLIEKDTLIEFLDLQQKILDLEKLLMIDTVSKP